MNTRDEFKKRVADKLGTKESARVMRQYDELLAHFNGDEYQVLTVIEDACKKLASSFAATDFRPILSPAGNAIFQTLETANKNTKIETNPILRIKELAERHAKNLSKMSVLLDGKPALSEKDIEKIQIKIPCQKKRTFRSESIV